MDDWIAIVQIVTNLLQNMYSDAAQSLGFSQIIVGFSFIKSVILKNVGAEKMNVNLFYLKVNSQIALCECMLKRCFQRYASFFLKINTGIYTWKAMF